MGFGGVFLLVFFLRMYELEGFIFQPKGPVSDFVVFIFRVTRPDIFTGKQSEPLHRGSDTNHPREIYGECTGLWPVLLFNTPADTLSQELKAQLQKCQVMTFSFPFENYPTVICILPVRKPSPPPFFSLNCFYASIRRHAKLHVLHLCAKACFLLLWISMSLWKHYLQVSCFPLTFLLFVIGRKECQLYRAEHSQICATGYLAGNWSWADLIDSPNSTSFLQ